MATTFSPFCVSNHSFQEPKDQSFASPEKVNVARDSAWALAASRGASFGGKTFWGQTGAQWSIGTIAMTILALGQILYHKTRGEELSPQEEARIWTPVAAASLSIPMWNWAQSIPENWYGSFIEKGLVAAPFTGMFEGFTQWIVKYAIDVKTNPVTQKMWSSNPSLMRKLFVKELLLNITVGALPGAVWQLVYYFGQPLATALCGDFWGSVVTATLVALAVLIANLASAYAINRLSYNSEEEELRKKAVEVLTLNPAESFIA